MIPISTRVLLAGGEPGRVIRVVCQGPAPEPVCYIVQLENRRSNGDALDVLLESEMEVAKEGHR